MQLRLKGFVGIEPLISNVEGIVSAIGEISTRSLTYSKDVGTYNSDAYPTYAYYSFYCADAVGEKVAVPAVTQGQVFLITDWIYDSQRINGAPVTRAEFLADFVAQFGGTYTSLNCGEMVQADSNFFFPEWVSFQRTQADENGDTSLVTVWFADASFQDQYDEYAITVVPPVANLEVFFAGKAQVLAALAAQGTGATLARVQVAKAGHPETILSGENFDWIELSTSGRTPTNWTLLIYGAAGDDLDAIRQAIRNYIAANSTRPEADWRAIFPDIYKNTEFVIFPRWELWAIPDRVLFQGTHSPVIKLKKELDYLKQVLPAVTPSFLDAHGTVIPCNYKSLMLLLAPSEDNRIGTIEITDLYPDIINVPTSDTLWEAMALDTRLWLEGIHQMVMTAETMGPYTDLPDGFRRTVRAGVIYITKKFNDVNFLVASKATTPLYA